MQYSCGNSEGKKRSFFELAFFLNFIELEKWKGNACFKREKEGKIS